MAVVFLFPTYVCMLYPCFSVLAGKMIDDASCSFPLDSNSATGHCHEFRCVPQEPAR